MNSHLYRESEAHLSGRLQRGLYRPHVSERVLVYWTPPTRSTRLRRALLPIVVAAMCAAIACLLVLGA